MISQKPRSQTCYHPSAPFPAPPKTATWLSHLPTGADAIGVWLETGDLKDHELQADINVWARLADANGRYRNVSLGGFAGPSDTGAEGWRLLKGEMPDGSADASRQWFLAAITFSTSSFVAVPAGRVHMDDFTVFGSSLPGDGVVVESFNALGNWHPLETAGSFPDRLEISTPVRHAQEKRAWLFPGRRISEKGNVAYTSRRCPCLSRQLAALGCIRAKSSASSIAGPPFQLRLWE